MKLKHQALLAGAIAGAMASAIPFAAVLNFIPYVGPLVTIGVLLLAGILSFSEFGLMIAPACAFIALNMLESNIVSPYLMGRRLDLNPLFIFLSVMFWGGVWGVGGALIAVPLLLAFRDACRHTRKWRHLCRWLERPAKTTQTLHGLIIRRPPRQAIHRSAVPSGLYVKERATNG